MYLPKIQPLPPSRYGRELEQLQMAAFRCVIQQEYIRQVAESACFPFSFVIKYAAQQRSPEVSKMALSLKSNVAVAHPTTSGWSHISRVYIRWVFGSGSLFHLNWIVFNATVFLCIWTQSELGFSSEGAAAAMMANLLKSATKWSRSPLIPDTARRTQIFWLRSEM